MQKFLSQLNIPRDCKVGNTIFKKVFYENASITKADEKIIKEHIDKIIWQYCLKPDTINIQAFKDATKEYPEIEVITVTLNNNSKVKRIAEIIMRNIPYPLLLVFSFEDKLQLYAAHQRQSLGDESKNTIEEFISTGWFNMDELDVQDELFIETIDFTKLSQLNFYRMYTDLVDKINIYNASKLIKDDYIANMTANDVKLRYDEIKEIELKIAKLKSSVKKNTPLQDRVDISNELKKLRTQKDALISQMK